MHPKLLKLSEVIDRTTLSETEIYRRMNAGTFPRSIPLGPQRVAWIETEVSEWVGEQIKAAKNPNQPAQEG